MEVVTTMTLFVCLIAALLVIGYYVGHRAGRLKSDKQYARKLSELARKSVEYELHIERMNVVLSRITNQKNIERLAGKPNNLN